MRLFVAVKINRKTYVHEELHKIWIPDFTEPGFYRSVVSYGAFAHNGDQEKNRGNWSSTHLYVLKRWEELVHDCDWLAASGNRIGVKHPDDRDLPTVEHTTIWAFYLYEGYDYKKKKWTLKRS